MIMKWNVQSEHKTLSTLTHANPVYLYSENEHVPNYWSSWNVCGSQSHPENLQNKFIIT